MQRAPLPREVTRTSSELRSAPVVIKVRLSRPDLVHCVVRPRFRPRGVVRSSWSSCGQAEGEDGYGLELGYKLDEYQELAGKALQEGESVVVSAPTTSGKTTVALLALSLALRKPGRSVFCAPIKALSNQMFSEFHAKFPGKVGLLTGDHCIGQESPILVMTTEIFRCLLHNDSAFVLGLRAAIFDEVHFLADVERGPAWEECIALLPPGVPVACLSATMANPLFLAGWLAQIKCSPTHAIQKKGRPVPLRHFVHPIGGDPSHLFEVLDADGRVHPNHIELAARHVDGWHGKWQQRQQRRLDRPRQEQAKWQQAGEPLRDDRRTAKQHKSRAKHELNQERLKSLRGLLTHLLATGQKPVLLFCFSKGACDMLATDILSWQGIDACERKGEIQRLINSELQGVPEDLRSVEQVLWGTQDLLPQSIGVHHAGMVPVLRELTEILFKRGLLDVLICTETFGMGLNMPARTVIFNFRPGNPLTKFDGVQQRVLTPTEYMQMSGRAGRRKKDTHGTAILALNDPFERRDLHDMLGRQNPAVRSHYEMQVSSALQVLRHGRGFLDWFGQQTLLQFEAQGCSEPVLRDDLSKLMAVMQHEELGLTDDSEELTERGKAISGMNCGDVLLVSKLLVGGCFDGVEPLDLLAYLSVFILERPAPDDSKKDPFPDWLAELAELCEDEAAAVDKVLAEAKVHRLCDNAGQLWEQLHERTYLVVPLRSTWLSGSSFDEAAHACYDCCWLDAGTLVRLIRRLDEFSTEVQEAAKRLKNTGVAAALADARKQLRRGLPFMDSLYFPPELRDSPNEVVRGMAPAEDEADVDCWACAQTPGQLVRLDACSVGFSHDSVAASFRDGCPLRRKLGRLLRREEDADEFAASMRVVFYRGSPYTLGNRRLAVLRMYSWVLPEGQERKFAFKVAAPQEALDWGWRRKFTTGCFRGARAVIRQTGEVIGISLHDSMCTLEEETDATIEDALEDNTSARAGGNGSFLDASHDRSFWDQYQDLPAELREGDAEVLASEPHPFELALADILGEPEPPAEGPREEPQRPVQVEELRTPRRFELVFTSRPFGMTPCKALEDGYIIASVSEMKPADRGGVLPGWRLVAVAGQATDGLGREEVQQLLRAAELPVQVAFQDVPANAMFCTACQKVLLASDFPQGARRRPAARRCCERCCREAPGEGDAAAQGTGPAGGAAPAAAASGAAGSAAARGQRRL